MVVLSVGVGKVGAASAAGILKTLFGVFEPSGVVFHRRRQRWLLFTRRVQRSFLLGVRFVVFCW
jgi:hypothetical protein